jgi:metallo-beta-lactamase class B
MRRLLIGFGTAVLVGAGIGAPGARAQQGMQYNTSPILVDSSLMLDTLLGEAKAAAGTDWAGTFLRLCVPPLPVGGAARGGGAAAGRGAGAGGAGRGAAPAAGAATAGRGRGTPPREQWYAEPAKVADNLYFLGTRIHSAWAIVGNEGIIVLEALYDYAAQDEILGGLKKVGLDPAKVKYVLISHAHGDHDGGAKLLQDSIPGVHLVYGKEDWDAVDARTGAKPKHDVVGTDGMVVSAGDASVKIVTMPGHTPGTLSFLFEVKDNGKPLRVAYVGGTAIPFNGDAAYYDGYIASSKKMADAAVAFGATVLMTNHTEFDAGYFRSHTAANRKPGEMNPYEVGAAAVARYFTVVQSCAEATKVRASMAKN